MLWISRTTKFPAIDGFCLWLAIVAKTKPRNGCNVYILIQFSKQLNWNIFYCRMAKFDESPYILVSTPFALHEYAKWILSFGVRHFDLEEKPRTTSIFHCSAGDIVICGCATTQISSISSSEQYKDSKLLGFISTNETESFFFKWKHHYFALAWHIKIANILWTDLFSIVVTEFLLAFGLLFSCAEIDVELEIGKIEF